MAFTVVCVNPECSRFQEACECADELRPDVESGAMVCGGFDGCHQPVQVKDTD